jgi:hypothetical protein
MSKRVGLDDRVYRLNHKEYPDTSTIVGSTSIALFFHGILNMARRLAAEVVNQDILAAHAVSRTEQSMWKIIDHLISG